jgi:predicted TIM-barrel fold metal-dependent hydrolase
MAVIDIDTHFEPGRSWLAERPALAARLPEYSTAIATMRAQVGDILDRVPEAERPPVEQLLPPGLAAILGQVKVDGYGFDGSAMHTPADPVARLAWMDRVGIDITNVLCLEGAGYARYVDDRALAREAISACNTWLADQVHGHTDRLLPATSLDLTDMAWALAELTRMRERGSRTFLVSPVPVPGLPAMHPYYEPLWSAAEDLGMVAMVHTGSAKAAFDAAWANTDDMTVLRQLGACLSSQGPTLMMNGMVFGGVFDRHPALTLVFAEFGVHWFAGVVDHMEARGPALPESAIYMGPYPYELTPAETVRRNIRVTPLPRHHQSPVELLRRYPECVVFSSDYAHNESNPEPTAHYASLFATAGIDAGTAQQFLGGTIAGCFARTGDPLPTGANGARS